MKRSLTWLFLEPHSLRRSLVAGAVVALLECGILLIAATIDGNFWLPGNGIGLLQHPGIPAIILADFVVLTVAAAVAKKFSRLVSKLPVFPRALNRRFLRRLLARGRAAIVLRGRSLPLFLFCSGLGLLFWIINAIQTLDPIWFYGHDVFDSYRHSASYISFRIVLGLSWILIYPYCSVVILSVAVNIYVGTKILRRRRQLSYKTFHPDHCGGFSFIGDINFLIIVSMLSLYLALITVIYTHHKLNVLQISGFFILSVSFIVLTFMISWPTIAFLLNQRRSMMLWGYKAALTSTHQSIMQLIWLTTVSSFSPYSPYQKVIINVSRLVPIVIGAVRIIREL